MLKLTQELVRHLFDYQDGVLYWKNPTHKTVKPGTKAGCLNGQGYIQVGIQGFFVKAHRIIFVWHHGYEPKEIDHLDRNRRNNRIENLRECTRSENMKNRNRWKWKKSSSNH